MLMEQPGGVDKGDHHIINIPASNPDNYADQPATTLSSVSQPPAAISNGNNSSVNFRLLLLRLELALAAAQIVASAVGLAFSTHEKPLRDTLLRELIVAYAIGCVAALPLLCWDYHHPDGIPEHVSPSDLNFCCHRIIQFETVLSLVAEDDTEGTTSRPGSENPSMVQVLVKCSRIALNAFFAYWLMLAGIELRSARSSSSSAPILFGLWTAFFSFSCFGHALAFIICPMLRMAGGLTQRGGASSERINALPAYTFKLKRGTGGNGGTGSSPEKGGVVAAGTDKERVISGEDAVCAICLAMYADKDELMELPCSHLLHRDCVDKWLKIKATCPLCKSVICGRALS